MRSTNDIKEDPLTANPNISNNEFFLTPTACDTTLGITNNTKMFLLSCFSIYNI